MGAIRLHILVPKDLVRDIDELAGMRGRSAFFVETAADEVRRRKMLAFLNRGKPAWREEDHPDIAEQGSAAWVHNLRRTRSARQRKLDKLAARPGKQ